jgi:hypothetical protein
MGDSINHGTVFRDDGVIVLAWIRLDLHLLGIWAFNEYTYQAMFKIEALI